MYVWYDWVMKTVKNEKSGKGAGKRKLLVFLGLLAAFMITVFVFRGWVRMRIIPKTINVVYGNPAQNVFEKEMSKLQNPLALLGYTHPEVKMNNCLTSYAQGLSTQVVCSYNIGVYRETPQDTQFKADLNANADKLQKLLSENVWQGEYSSDGKYTSLKKLVSSITAGIDYQPDAAYQKQVGNVLCYIDSNTAFSSPQPPAIATQISCSRTFNILGKPRYLDAH